MIELTVNGTPKPLPAPCVLRKALDELGFQGRHFAVAVNGRFVPRHQYEAFHIEGGEALEVLSPMQGG